MFANSFQIIPHWLNHYFHIFQLDQTLEIIFQALEEMNFIFQFYIKPDLGGIFMW